MNADCLLYLALECNGRYYDIKRMLTKQQRFDFQKLKATTEFLQNQGVSHVAVGSKRYPEDLKELSQPPFVLFCKGNDKLLDHPYKIFLTGDQLDVSVIDKLKQHTDVLAANTVLVSRSSTLEEQVIVKMFKDQGGKVIFVSSSGIFKPNCQFLSEHGFDPSKDLMISEHFWNKNSSSHTFSTLRICAALSRILVILSAKNVLNLLRIIDRFLETNKDVFCLIGKKDSTYSGLNFLRKIGVKAITTIQAQN